jgi:hypothetical protein
MSFVGHDRKTTAKDVRDVLVRFLDGTSGPFEFDDFVSASIGDPRLDAIRERCRGLWAEFPPELPEHYCGAGGFGVMRRCVEELGDDPLSECQRPPAREPT